MAASWFGYRPRPAGRSGPTRPPDKAPSPRPGPGRAAVIGPAGGRSAPGYALDPGAGCELGSRGSLRGRLAVQGVLKFLLVVLGQRGLQDRAAILAHRLDSLVRGDLLQHQEQCGGAWLDHAADLVL